MSSNVGLLLCLSAFLCLLPFSGAFLPPAPVVTSVRNSHTTSLRMQLDCNSNNRREALSFLASAGVLLSGAGAAQADSCTKKECQPKPNYLPEEDAKASRNDVPMRALGNRPGKSQTKYPDYTQTPSGLQYKDVKVGTGEFPVDGDRVVIDWEGYTIGYYGRIFQAKNKVQGGAFADDPGFYRYVLGSNSIVPGLEEGIRGMKQGGVRQIVVPPGPLSYPEVGDSGHNRVGPRPSTFDGMRALNFVLENQGLIDKTLLFNVKLIRVDKPGPDGSFTRQI